MNYWLWVANGTAFQSGPLPLQYPQFMGVAGDERGLTGKLLLRNRPEIPEERGKEKILLYARKCKL